MQCGAKCFLVKLSVDGKVKAKSVTARTQVTARKTIRNYYGNSAEIIYVKEKYKEEIK